MLTTTAVKERTKTFFQSSTGPFIISIIVRNLDFKCTKMIYYCCGDLINQVMVSLMRPQPKPGGAVKYNPAIHHRHSIRLKGYDYSSAGAYFITAVLQHRMHLFGRVCENGMQLSEAGKIAHRCWEEIPLHFPHTALDEFVIMPDHMHGIVVIVEGG